MGSTKHVPRGLMSQLLGEQRSTAVNYEAYNQQHTRRSTLLAASCFPALEHAIPQLTDREPTRFAKPSHVHDLRSHSFACDGWAHIAARLRRESGASDGDTCRMSSASRAKSLAGVLRAKPFSPIFFRVINSSSTIPESPGMDKIYRYTAAARVGGKVKTQCDHRLSVVYFFCLFHVLTDGGLGYNSIAATKRGIFQL